MTNLSLDITNLQTFVSDEQLAGNLPRLKQIHQDILDKKTPGSEMLGWVDLPVNYDRQELDSIKKAAVAIQKQSSVLVVIGIGGSHLGAQAALEVLRGSYYNQLQPETPEIYFAGHNLCADEWQTVAKIIGDRDFSLNVISKSGTTLEPALAFGYFQDLLVKNTAPMKPINVFTSPPTKLKACSMIKLSNVAGRALLFRMMSVVATVSSPLLVFCPSQ